MYTVILWHRGVDLTSEAIGSLLRWRWQSSHSDMPSLYLICVCMLKRVCSMCVCVLWQHHQLLPYPPMAGQISSFLTVWYLCSVPQWWHLIKGEPELLSSGLHRWVTLCSASVCLALFIQADGHQCFNPKASWISIFFPLKSFRTPAFLVISLKISKLISTLIHKSNGGTVSVFDQPHYLIPGASKYNNQVVKVCLVGFRKLVPI